MIFCINLDKSCQVSFAVHSTQEAKLSSIQVLKIQDSSSILGNEKYQMKREIIMKQNRTIYVFLGIFVLYFTSVLLENTLWGNLLSPMVALMSALIILKSIKQVADRVFCFLLFLCPFIWGIADLLWLIYSNVLFINPDGNTFIETLYILPNLVLVILISLYGIKNFKSWSVYQLIIDVVSISAMWGVLLWAFVFSKTGLEFRADFTNLNIIIITYLDLYLLTGIGLVYLSKGFKNISTSSLLILVGILLFALTDYYYAYLYLLDRYHANTIIDGIYMLSNVLYALGVSYEVSHPTLNQQMNELPPNLRKPSKLSLLFLALFGFFYLIDFFDFKVFIVSFSICILYWVLTSYLQAAMADKQLLKMEMRINEQLEKTVAERTNELAITNKYLEEISNKDHLTGLYNRRYLIHYLNTAISSDRNKTLALLYIDVNRFKAINDFHGHHIGDKVLSALGERFSRNGMINCTVFRIGGDEFAVILENYLDKEYLSSAAAEILAIIRSPILVPPHSFVVTASIGIALYPEDTRDKDILMKYADIAMYEVKNSLCNEDYLFFYSALKEKINRKHEIELLLKNADYDKEFMLCFQPQYNTNNHSLIGMEALLRWKPPEKGYISPVEFIPIAEEVGAIIDISEWVINQAFSQIKYWNETYRLNLKMSVNISPIQIENSDFIMSMQEKLRTFGIKPAWIDLEVTEGVAMNPNFSSGEIFNFLNELGINISLDDFGTGYSSLSYIRRFNIDRLKIAKELIDNICKEENALVIVQAIIMMAKEMKLKTIAEGVEDMDQLQVLEKLRCDEIQGYIFGKPVLAEEFEKKHITKVSTSKMVPSVV